MLRRKHATCLLALYFLIMICVAGSDGETRLSLDMDGPATMCRGSTSWVLRNCQMLAGESIPTIVVALFDLSGAPCCGENQVAVRLKVTKGAREYELLGFADVDSTPGGPGSRMTVQFSNLKLADRMAVGEFNLTASAFYDGIPLEYKAPVRILPNGINLLPWGSWTSGVQILPDKGPWSVHEPLPPFRLALQVQNSTVTVNDAESFMVGARLFRPVGLLDISLASLEGITIQQANGGVAVFNGLRVSKAAGAGYRLSFFLVGSDKECAPNALRRVCEEWEASRSLGGMGGYHVELLGPELTIVPDRLLVTPYGVLEAPWRMGELLKAYRISVYDSVDMGAVLSEVTSADDLQVTAGLISSTGADVTATSLAGTTTRILNFGVAEFDDLIVRDIVGVSFTLVFAFSWRDRCIRKLRDLACRGECCIQVPNINIYPQQLRVGQPDAVPSVTEGDLLANFSLWFADFDGNVLTSVGHQFGLQARAYLVQRGIFVPDKLVGEAVVDVVDGIGTFKDLRVSEHAGRLMSIMFLDRTSQISVSSNDFDVFPRSIFFDGTLDNSVTGGPIRTGNTDGSIEVQLLSSQQQILTSISSMDNFTVEVYGLFKNGSAWMDCRCLQGPKASVAEHGVAVFNGSLLSIPSAVGTFSLQFRLDRQGLSTLSVLSNAFQLKPQGIEIKTSSLLSEYLVGEILGSVTLGFTDADGAPITEVGDLDTGSFQAVLMQGSNILASHTLAGSVVQGIVSGVAAYTDLSVERYAGSSLVVKFIFSNTLGNETTIFEVSSSTFTVRPARIDINNSRPDSVTDRSLPSLNASIRDVSGGPLAMTEGESAFELTVELLTLRFLGCASSVVISSTWTSTSWEQCAQNAIAADVNFFVTRNAGFCGLVTSPPAGLSCATGCEILPATCNASYSVTNSTSSLIGPKRKVVGNGFALFTGLRITGLYGIKSSIVAFRNRGMKPDVVAFSNAITVEPSAWTVTGLPSTGHILSQPLPVTSITATDLNGHALDCVFAQEAYDVQVQLMHAGTRVNHRLDLPHSRKMPSNTLSFQMKFLETGGSNFSVMLSLKWRTYDGGLVSNSSNFVIYPDRFILVGPQGEAFDSESDTVLPSLMVRCETVNGSLITDIQARDGIQMVAGATNFRLQDIPACSTTKVSACLGGSRKVLVENGTAVFTNVILVAFGGAETRLYFSIAGGGPSSVRSPRFTLFPAKLYFSEGEYDDEGVQRVINKGLGDYALSARALNGDLVTLAAQEGFKITASLEQAAVDRSENLAGTLNLTAGNVSQRQASAIFTDLVLTAATGDLKLVFTLSHPNSARTVQNSTTTFKAAPYALRISQSCFNGNTLDSSITEVRFGVPSLDCVSGGAGLGQDFGRFGYLTGYYRYEDNQNIGPLLLNARGVTRVPPIHVLGIDLYLKTQALIQPSHDFQVNLKVFVGETQYTDHVIGSTFGIMLDGVAKFEGLQISSIPGCSPSCLLQFRFNLDGVLCADTWCTNVTMNLTDAPIVAPHLLGSHPAFPGRSRIEGQLKIHSPQNCVGPPFPKGKDIEILQHALLMASQSGADVGSMPSGVPFVTLDNIEIDPDNKIDPAITPADTWIVPFRISAKSYAASTWIMSRVTEQFRPSTIIIAKVCALRNVTNVTEVKLCNSCVDTELDGRLIRMVVSHLMDDRVKKPTFEPPGLPAGICLQGDFSTTESCEIHFSAFAEFQLALSVVEDEGDRTEIHYTFDTCPVATQFCNTTGTIPSRDRPAFPVFQRCVDCAKNGDPPRKVFSTSPTHSLMPDGMSDNSFRAYFVEDQIKYELEAAQRDNLDTALLESEKYVAVHGNRQTSNTPLYLTAKAYATANRHLDSFLASTTFKLAPQASTPEIDFSRGQLWVLGWCNETHSSYPSARIGQPFLRRGSCADLYADHGNDSSVCTGAAAVPCKLRSPFEGVCTAGSKSYILQDHGVYDGTLFRGPGTTSLARDFAAGDSHLFVESLADLGFTNEGLLNQMRELYINQALFIAKQILQDEGAIEVEYEHEYNFVQGSVVSLNNTCTASLVHASMIFPMWTSTPGASIYYNVPGQEPTISSNILGSANSVAIRVETENSLRAVAGGDNLMNSPYLHLDVSRPCGNGFLNGGEQCDDGNLVDGDGCSSKCMHERQCSASIWQDVFHSNVGIHFMGTGANNSQADVLNVREVPSNSTGLMSDCTGYLIVSQMHELVTGGDRHEFQDTTAGRMADGGCTATIGSEILFIGNYLHTVNQDKRIFSYDVETEVFSESKYEFRTVKNSIACQGSGQKGYFAGGLSINDARTAYISTADVDVVEVIPPVDEGDPSTIVWQYGLYQLSEPRAYLQSTQVDGVLYFSGGANYQGSGRDASVTIVANFDILDTATGIINSTSMPNPRYFHAMTAVGHLVLTGGGVNSVSGFVREVDIYDTRYKNFTTLMLPGGARALLAAAATPTKAFFAGGFDSSGRPTSKVDMFDLTTGNFVAWTPLAEKRYHLIGVSAMGRALFGGGRRSDTQLGVTASAVVDFYEDVDGNHTSQTMSTPRFFHYGGAAKQFAVFGLGAGDDPGFANILDWLNEPLMEDLDIFDLSPLKTVVRANVTSQTFSKMATMPFYNAPTRTRLSVDLGNFNVKYTEEDKWRLTCDPGYRKSVYETVPATTVYNAFMCICTNLTNFFNKPSLFPSDQAVMLRYPMPQDTTTCGDLCAPPQNMAPRTYQGLRVQYTGASAGVNNYVHRHGDLDDLQIRPGTTNKFCNTTDVATVSNLHVVNATVRADVTTSGNTLTVILPYTFPPPIDFIIDIPESDAENHLATDTWTLYCGGNTTGHVIFSFDLAPSVCNLVLTPFI